MIKVLPLILIPSIFFLVFFNVRNLTSKNEDFYKEGYVMSDQIDKIIKNEDSTMNKKIDDPTINTLPEKEPNRKLIDIKNNKNQEIIEKPTMSESTINPNTTVTKAKKNISNEEIKKTNSNQNNTQKKIKIQFGAFSKINNAEKQKDLISRQISVKYPDFSNNLKIRPENNLFKLIYIPKNREVADSICKFSKSKKINCLILKK